MIDACNGTATRIVENATRLARDLYVQEAMLKDAIERDLTIISTTEDDLTNTTDPTRVMIRQILGAFSQFEKANIVAKLRHARETKKATEGRCEGRKPYGAYPGEAGTLERMKQIHAEVAASAEHKTVQAIFSAAAARLNEEGLKPREAAKWTWNPIYKILRRARSAA